MVLLAGFLPAKAGETTVASSAAASHEDLLKEWWEGDYATGNWGGLRDELSENGVEVNILNVSELWSNLDGGIKTGANLMGYWEWGLSWDLEPLTGWKGADIVVDGNWYYGGLPSDELVGLFPGSALSNFESSNALRMYHMYFQQSWGEPFPVDADLIAAGGTPVYTEDEDGNYVFRIGQFAADDDFMGSVYGGLFTNASFGQYVKEASATAAPAYRLTAPGALFFAQPVKEWFFRVAAFSGNAGEDLDSNNGFGWRWGGATGIATFVETGTRLEINGLPGRYVVGGFYDTSQFDTFDGTTTRGNWNVWLTMDQAILMQKNGHDPLLGLFARIVPAPANNRNPVDWEVEGGAVLYGEPWGRPQDQLGVGITSISFPHEVITGEGLAAGGQTVIETTYLLQVNNWLFVQPDIQYIFDPSFGDGNALAAGVRVGTQF